MPLFIYSIACVRQKRYTGGMSADEDFNEFNSWDSGGAAFMLAVVPAVMYYVFSDHDRLGTVMLLGIAVGAGLLVFLVAHFTHSRIVGRLMQVVGISLCVVYWLYAFHLWATHNRLSPPPAAEQSGSPQEAA